MARWMAATVVAMAVTLGAPSHADASDYLLESVPFLEPGEVTALKKLPAHTTNEAGAALARPAARRKAAKRIKMKGKRLAQFAQLFDLMRVRGIGPNMARLLRAADVRACHDLAGQDPVTLEKRLAEVNAKEKIAGKLPDAAILRSWVEQAAGLPAQYRPGR